MKKFLCITLALIVLACALGCASRRQLSPNGYRQDIVKKRTVIYYSDGKKNYAQTFPGILDSVSIHQILWSPIAPTK